MLVHEACSCFLYQKKLRTVNVVACISSVMIQSRSSVLILGKTYVLSIHVTWIEESVFGSYGPEAPAGLWW